MEDESSEDFGAATLQPPPPPPPTMISLTPFSPAVSPSPRRLSSCYTQPSRPIFRKLAWVSLQGRLVNAEEATSAKTICNSSNGGGFNRKEAAAWELFTPIQRVVVVAVIAVASKNFSKIKEINHLKKAVELRDQVLLSMQQKLDNLCEQLNYFKDHSDIATGLYGCRFCEQHMHLLKDPLGSSVAEVSNREEVLKFRTPLVNEAAEAAEERRMSDLSDWAPSTISSVDIQANSSAIEQDIYNLRKECEEKDATIKDLSTFLHSSEMFGSKRITELEDIIRRKNMIITKLKKDILALEQKVVSLTRSRRRSSSSTSSKDRPLPVMADNVLYDMDSTTSLSSSDSDTSPKDRIAPPAKILNMIQKSETALRENKVLKQAGSPSLLPKPSTQYQESRTVSPLKEKSLNYTPDSVTTSSRQKQHLSANFRSRRQAPASARSSKACPQKRWV